MSLKLALLFFAAFEQCDHKVSPESNCSTSDDRRTEIHTVDVRAKVRVCKSDLTVKYEKYRGRRFSKNVLCFYLNRILIK